MDQNTYAFMVNLTAQMEVMRIAVPHLASSHVRSLPAAMQESALLELQTAMSNLPVPGNPSEAAEDAFHKHVVSVAPGHAQHFVQELRQTLSQTN